MPLAQMDGRVFRIYKPNKMLLIPTEDNKYARLALWVRMWRFLSVTLASELYSLIMCK